MMGLFENMKIHPTGKWLALTLCALGFWGAPTASALMIGGKEVEDVYEYILKTLEEDARVQEEYRKQTERNPSFRGIRPYTYSTLSHLSVEDLLYGAVQGGLSAVRDAGPNASRSLVVAACEANIQRIMELIPMLSKDFTTGQTLLQRMIVSGRKDYVQEFLLKRSRPGYANDSLFAAFWRDEIERNHDAYIAALDTICNDLYSGTEPLLLALRLYIETLEEEGRTAFESDSGIAPLLGQADTNVTLARAVADENLSGQMADPGLLQRHMRKLAPLRKSLENQLDPALQREEEVKVFAEQQLALLDAAFPAVREMQATEPAPNAAPLPAPAEGEMAAPPEEPEESTTPSGFPKIGIPTLKGF
jgi:hypothetical protein